MKIIKKLFVIIVLIALYTLFIDIVRFPEWYSTTGKYHLYNDIQRGDELAIEYYNNNYVKHNRILFEEE